MLAFYLCHMCANMNMATKRLTLAQSGGAEEQEEKNHSAEIYCYLRLHLLAIQSETIIVITYYLNKCIDDVCTRAMVRPHRHCCLDLVNWFRAYCVESERGHPNDIIESIRFTHTHTHTYATNALIAHSIRLHYKSDADFRISLLVNSTECAFDAVCNVFCWRFFLFFFFQFDSCQLTYHAVADWRSIISLKRFDATVQIRRRCFCQTKPTIGCAEGVRLRFFFL